MSNTGNLKTGREFLKSLQTSVARFYPCDFHMHTPGSFDVCQSGRIDDLPEKLKKIVDKTGLEAGYSMPLPKCPDDPSSFDQAMATDELVEATYKTICDRRNEVASESGISDSDNWSIVAVTDHNVATFAEKLSKLAWSKKKSDHLIFLPGVELDIEFTVSAARGTSKIHVLCLFQPLTTASDIRVAISSCLRTDQEWEMGKPIKIETLASFVSQLRQHSKYPAICIAAHVWSAKGIQNEPTKQIFRHLEAEVARLEGELVSFVGGENNANKNEIERHLELARTQLTDSNSVHLEVLKIIGRCGFDALQVQNQAHESHYRRLHRFREDQGRGVPIVSSDAHTPSRLYDCDGGTLFCKLAVSSLASDEPSVIFNELRDRVLRFGETRTTYSKPGHVSHWIEGLEITPESEEAAKFWKEFAGEPDVGGSFYLELSRNLTCFIGGRGSGKSAGIEALAYLCDPSQFDEEPKRKVPRDWYSRARATLAGCHVRIVWKTTADNGIGRLPKRALVVTRYFDPDDQHPLSELRDVDDQAIVDPEVVSPKVRILRVHEIEMAAEATNLRKLFDDLCGTTIYDLDKKIERTRERLRFQRMEVFSVVDQLMKLTTAGSPIRQYGVRKLQFEQVNKEELRRQYEAYDTAIEVKAKVEKATSAWSDLGLADSVSQSTKDFLDYLDLQRSSIPTKDGSVADGYSELSAIFSAVSSNSDSSPESSVANQLKDSLLRTQKLLQQFEDELQKTSKRSETLAVSLSDALAKAGLPAASGARSAKKTAFDKAVSDLAEYEALIERLHTLLSDRDILRKELADLAKARTNNRKAEAERITEELARDLDPTLILIKIGAKPMFDQSEYVAWLDTNVGLCLPRFKAARIKAIIDSGIEPAVLRDALLEATDDKSLIFENQIGKAEAGKIDAETSRKIVETCKGRAVEVLDEREQWNAEFVAGLPLSIRDGIVTFPESATQTASSCFDHVLEIDEIVLDDDTEIYLNDRPSDPESQARPLSELSPGQRCSAILPMMLLSGDYPLIIDQPEENLDNRLVRQVIVNILAAMKMRRQIIIATHNPNLPVLGDAEQCVILQAKGKDLSEVVATGNLDSASVANYVTDIMEGGREAFQYRQSIYQNHWRGYVDETL